jgi:hypothetical protein
MHVFLHFRRRCRHPTAPDGENELQRAQCCGQNEADAPLAGSARITDLEEESGLAG